MFAPKDSFGLLESKSVKIYQLTSSDLKRMHDILLEMYQDLKTICDKYDLKLIAGGGTALGAVRHHGFIPWDDDMDLGLSRNEYEILKKVFDFELSEKYNLLAPGYHRGSNVFFMRIMKKNTTLLGMIDETSPYPHGIYIDIMPIDYVPENQLKARFKGIASDLLRFISYSVYWYQYRSPSLADFMLNSEGKTYYKLRIVIGKLFSFKRAEEWFTVWDKFIQSKPSSKVTVAAGRKKYFGEIFPIEIYFPPRKVCFENTEIYVHNDADYYLTKLYGDYRKIPDVKDREKHLCLRLDFNK